MATGHTPHYSCLTTQELDAYDRDLRQPHLTSFIRLGRKHHLRRCHACRSALAAVQERRTGRFTLKARQIRPLPL